MIGYTEEQREERFQDYRRMLDPTTMHKLKFIEDLKVIYNIHYCNAGVGIVFYYEKPNEEFRGDTWKNNLRCDRYYKDFETCIAAEAQKIVDSFMSGR